MTLLNAHEDTRTFAAFVRNVVSSISIGLQTAARTLFVRKARRRAEDPAKHLAAQTHRAEIRAQVDRLMAHR